MNPEHNPSPRQEHTAPPRDERDRTHFVAHTRHEVREIERLSAEHGAPFDIYLKHVWRDTPVLEMETDFENLYWASYDTTDHFVDDFIENLGWDGARKQLLQDWAIPDKALIFDRDAILENLDNDYEFIRRDRVTHVFIA